MLCGENLGKTGKITLVLYSVFTLFSTEMTTKELQGATVKHITVSSQLTTNSEYLVQSFPFQIQLHRLTEAGCRSPNV